MSGTRANNHLGLALVAGGLMLCGVRVPAQSGTNVIETSPAFFNQVWQTEDGLPHNDVHGMVASEDGFLWVGTRRGLVRFDGARFVAAPSVQGSDLAQSSVWRMGADHEGRVAVALEAGGVVVKQNGAFHAIRVGGPDYSKRAYSMCFDPAGRLWSVSLDGEVERIYEGSVTPLGTPGKGASGPSTLAVDAAGRVWLASHGTLGYFRGDEFVPVMENQPTPLYISAASSGGVWLATSEQLYRVSHEGAPLEGSRFPWLRTETNVRDLLEDRAGAIWVGTSSKGLVRYLGGSFQAVTTSHASILCLREDKFGHVWVGTQGGGLNQIRRRQFKVLDAKRGLPNDSVFSFAEDQAGRVWIATQENGLCHWSNGVVTVMGEAQGWPQIPPLCLAADSQGGVWIGTQKHGLIHRTDAGFKFFTRDLGLTIDEVDCLLADREGRLWAGSVLEGLFCVEGGRVKHYATNDGLSSISVRCVTQDKQGRIWVGTDDGGLSVFSKGRFQSFSPPRRSGEAVRSLLATEDGSIWVGTAGSGLLRFKQGMFAPVDATRGLPDDSIQQMLLDDAGWLWCGTTRGLFRAELSDLNAVAEGRIPAVTTLSYGRSDGLPGFQFTGEFQPAACRTAAGRFWFASVRGAVVFQPGELQQNRQPPPISIESVRRNGQLLRESSEALLEPGVQTLEFNFTAPDYGAPERVRYRHRLGGAGSDWSAASAAGRAVYANVPPGSHRFQVIACNADGIWNEQGVSLNFSVSPFFWQTRWFPPVAAAAVVGLLALVGRWVALRRLQQRIAILEQEHTLERERSRIAQDIHDELGANLTTIGWLADRGRKPRAEPAAVSGELEQIAATARESLTAMDAIVWALNARNDSLENYANYISHFATEFFRPTSIRCRLDIPTQLPVQPMSTESRHHLFLAVKEALNNAARHSGASEVWIRLACDAERLLISVEDNGRGIQAAVTAPGQDGLANIRRRLEALGGMLLVESLTDGRASGPGPEVNTQPDAAALLPTARGTCLRFSVPVEKLNS
jgi:ligand-binding sensor domain-containing protein/signal transduction histidine kinase